MVEEMVFIVNPNTAVFNVGGQKFDQTPTRLLMTLV